MKWVSDLLRIQLKNVHPAFITVLNIMPKLATYINKMELALRRDERILRFLTVALDKYGVKYNEDKRNGLIGKSRKEDGDKKDTPGVTARAAAIAKEKPAAAPAVVAAAPAVVEKPVADVPAAAPVAPIACC